MTVAYLAPVPITSEHNVAEFDSGREPETVWLRQIARQARKKGTAQVYVSTASGESLEVAGYYALAAHIIAREDAVTGLLRGTGKLPAIPAVLLARLAVDVRHQGVGLGASLLNHAIIQAVAASKVIGARAFLIHARDDEARAFYLHLLPDLERSPTHPLHLMALIQDIAQTLQL